MVKTSERCSSKGFDGKDKLYANFVTVGSSKLNALVDFGDEGTSVIRSDKIVEGSVDGKKCKVVWWYDEEYEVDLLFTGYMRV